MKTYIKIFFIFAVFFLLALPARAEVRLVKSPQNSTVYYLNGEKSRHAFPNFITYKSWFGDDFSKVVTVSHELLAKIPLGKNIVLRPGKYIVKVPSDPKIYAVEQGGVLRHIENEGILEYFYGKNWKDRLVDIPEVFFGDYSIGKYIKNEDYIPENTVYRIMGKTEYFWKENNTIQPFANTKAIEENGYDPKEAITATRVYYTRPRPIVGKNEKIFNPLLTSRKRTVDCENKNLKAAFVFVYRDSYTQEEAERIEKIKNEFSSYYLWATREFSKVDTSYPLVFLKADEYFHRKNGNEKLKLEVEEVASSFYDTNPDIFDFLIIFTNFDALQYKEQAVFIPITNRVKGVQKASLEAGETYGSGGKLKAEILMDNIQKYEYDGEKDTSYTMNLLMHEMLHQWSGEIWFTSAANDISDKLLKEKDLEHWNFYVSFLSPLGGAGWKDNGDGTFTSETSLVQDSLKKQFSDLDLYLMGLIPKQLMKPVYYVIPEIPNAQGNTIRGKKVMVTIDQIISANGLWACVL